MNRIYSRLLLSASIVLVIFTFNSCYNNYCDAYGGNSYRHSGNKKRNKSNVTGWNYNNGGHNQLMDVDSRTNQLDEIETEEAYINRIHSYDPLTNRPFPPAIVQYETYFPFEENEWVSAIDEAKSTFSIDVDNASYTNFRRYVNNKQLPPKDAIRIEEWLNFFNYELEAPALTDEHPLKISSELSTCPWNNEDDLLMIKLQAKLPPEEELPPSNIVFLLDVSGSMDQENKLPLVQESLILLTNKMRAQDRISIVTYAGADQIVLEPTSGTDKKKIIDAINSLDTGGGTAGAKGVVTAYELAEANFMEDGNNRIILCSDGDWNIGVNSKNGLTSLIEKKRKSGVFLSVLGFGMGNYNDGLMETLADNGNGNYAYIDSKKEADRIFNSEFAGSMYVIAKDVKLQLQFDPETVESYRLIGYENRVLENWQFEADSIDAGDLGMGQNVIAFYQVKRKKGSEGSFGKVDFRYKPVKSDESLLLSHMLQDQSEAPSSDFKFASCVVEFALCLRESEYRTDANMAEAILRGKRNLGDKSKQLSYEKRVEFVGLMEDVYKIWGGYIFEDATEFTEKSEIELKLYPNPAQAEVSVEVPQNLSMEWNVQVFDMKGALKQVYHFNETSRGELNISELAAGTYIVKIYGGGFNYGYLRLVKS